MNPTKSKSLVRRLKLRFVRWLGATAGNLCAWSYATEQRLDDREPCPDCHAAECYCGEKQDDDEMYDSIYQSGFDAGQRDMYR